MKLSTILTGALIMTLSLQAGKKRENPEEVSFVPTAVATFAGGCFWCMAAPFDKLPGVQKVISGYTGGTGENPSYKQVSGGKTGHREAVQIYFDSSKITYAELLDIFWKNINPTDVGGQFADRGNQYVTAIFYHDDVQKHAAVSSRDALEKSGVFEEVIVTAILPAKAFYPAEAYHQEYHLKNPDYYKQYHEGSGRSPFLRRMWGDGEQAKATEKRPAPLGDGSSFNRPSDAVLRKKLTKSQYDVAVCSVTEPPFDNEFWNNKREGIYVDIISGEPLFSSNDKYNSGTGWPSFTRPIGKESVVERPDTSHNMHRIEVRSKSGDAHLGHLFPDGPAPGSMRYCINSAALRFIPKVDLEKEGYGEYRKLFK